MEEHKCEHNDISYPKGLKWTKQRKCVYQVLEEATEPLSAVQIYNRIERDVYKRQVLREITKAAIMLYPRSTGFWQHLKNMEW